MAIIRYTEDATIRYAYLNIFPDQFKTDKEKQQEGWIKNTMDYFANKAYAEYVKNRETFVKNYDLVKGILRPEDFYQVPEVRSFIDTIVGDMELPKYVKNYSILTPPLNTMVGELINRPDKYMAKAFDDDSQSEELQAKTAILHEFIMNSARQKVMAQLAESGEMGDVTQEQVDEQAWESVKDKLESFTTTAESWANHILEAMKVDFNMKEKSEDAFRDLNISSREFFHIFEDNSRLGFNVEVANPKNVWYLTTPDRKYTSDNAGRGQGAYAGGTVEVMEISEIIEKCIDLTKEEIDHLRSLLQDYGLINVRESNLTNPNAPTGNDSVMYDTYDPLVLQTRMMIESEMKENNDGLKDFLGLTSNVSSFGYKYVVIRAYWLSKKKIGKVTYIDEVGNMQSTIVDENYSNKDIPTQVGSVEWGWVNQWYQGTKIGPDIYHVKPFKLLNYNPLIGQVFEIKNTESRSLIDMLKPYQVLYNICMNQMYTLLEKEIGNVGVVSIRRVPRVKDGDGQDDIDTWEMEARERGILFDDDSPENTKSPVSNQSVAKNLDLTRTNEIQNRYNLAVQLKNEAWELVGLNRQRLGGIQASETATATNTALNQSYAQTEPIFAAHEYVMNQVFQAILDAAQYTEAQKPESTVSYINAEGKAGFVKVAGTDIKLRDYKVFMTSRAKDVRERDQLKELAQPLLQNGGSFSDVIELYSNNSIREMKNVFNKLRKKQEEFQQQEQALKDKQLDQQQNQFEADLAARSEKERRDEAREDMNKELDRLNKKEVALIMALSRNESATADNDGSGVADALEITSQVADREEARSKMMIELSKVQADILKHNQEMASKAEDRKVTRENMKNDLQVEKMKLKNKPKPAAKSKK
jgi:hypothetical protein